MKKTTLVTSFCVLLASAAFAQHFDWVETAPIQYAMNPSYMHCPAVLAAGTNPNVYTARLDSAVQIYGQDVYGKCSVECRTSAGALLWHFALGQKAVIDRLERDAAGNIYAAGSYLATLRTQNVGSIAPTDSLPNTGTGFTTNSFLIKLSAQGVLVWKRNLALTHNVSLRVAALQRDAGGSIRYGLADFAQTSIIKIDNATAADLSTTTISGAVRQLGSIAFDPAGNMYVAGSATQGTLTLGNLSQTVAESYALYLARYNVAGQATWVRVMHDITFQSPQVVATPLGDAYFATTLYDSLTLGTIHVPHPATFTGYMLARVTSAGVFEWAMASPPSTGGATVGSFTLGDGGYLAPDADEGVALFGNASGNTDWGNGVTTNLGAYTNKGVAIVKITKMGTPHFALNSVGGNSLYAHQLLRDPDGNFFFTLTARGTIGFETLSIATNNANTFLLGKINTSVVSTDTPNGSTDTLPALFPNPSTGILTLPPSAQGCRIRITDASGKVVFSQNNLHDPVLHLAALPRGVYFVTLQSEAANHTYKWLRE